MRWFAGFLASTVLFSGFAIEQAAGQTPGPSYYGPMPAEWMWTMMGSGFMWLMPLGFLAAVAVFVALAIRLIAPRHWHHVAPGQGSTALGLLDARYARGEIAREEYLEKKKDIVA